MTERTDAGDQLVGSDFVHEGMLLAPRDDARVQGHILSGLRRYPSFAAMAAGIAVIVGFLVRLIAVRTLSPHVDEASSLLAAHAVAAHGVPILPSGTVYLQGATLSYLLQPLLWLGIGDLDDLMLLRLVLALAGTVTLYLCYRLGQDVTGNAWVGAVMAALVAIDPLSVQWSGHMRMYSLLQAITVGLVWAYVLLLRRGPSYGRVSMVVVLSGAAVFTHVGAALLVPAMVLAAAIIYRRALMRTWWLVMCLVLCALGPATLLALNQTLGSSGEMPRDGDSSTGVMTFVGDSLLAPLARFRIPLDEWDWASVTRAHNLFWLVPALIVAASTVIGPRLLARWSADRPEIRRAVIVLLSYYWLPVLAVGAFTVSPEERYLLNVHTIGYLFVAVLFVELARRGVAAIGMRGPRVAKVAGRALAFAMVLALGISLGWRLEHPVVQPDYNAALAYVVERHQPGEPVIVALPAVAELALDRSDRDDLYFLAGPRDQPRAQRYTRTTEDGELIDYWVGVESIVSTDRLRALLLEHPEAWIVVDEERLSTEWAYAGETERTLNAMTYPVVRTPGGALVLRSGPMAERSEPGSAWSEPTEDHPNSRVPPQFTRELAAFEQYELTASLPIPSIRCSRSTCILHIS